ncbi:TRAF3-interacting protein 1 isoform X1 [Microcaecilia unicolor]|uniref:TRAF3-interacting protein 1 n=1 Tax=Microcaecilia unicolor TaxID=1415580 RepID=A0A6P7YTF5_9AMPH|nr:TRAF3-interacting protein 1 isoform X1 [Microcaecilia unicolor]
MDSSVVRRTQESLGKVLRKPPLTDKLLGKPPFRYLHDIISEVIRSTGFMKGLYTEAEMKSDNVKDKDAKIGFLQKAIDVVVMVTEEPLSVKPARIIAGHEPEKTNELLQAIGKCCLSKLSSDDAVKRVLAGEKTDMKGKPPFKPQDKENRESKMQERKSFEDKVDRKDSEIRDRSSSRDVKDREQSKEERKIEKEKLRDSERDTQRDIDKDIFHNGEKFDKERNLNRPSRSDRDKEKRGKDREREKEREKDREKGQERERKNDGGKVKEKKKDREKGREKDKDHERDLEREKQREHSKEVERSKEKGREQEKPKELEKVDRKLKGAEEISARKPSESLKDSNADLDKESYSSLKISRLSAPKIQRQQPLGVDGGKEFHRKAETNNVSDEKMEKSATVPQIGTTGIDDEAETEKPMGSEVEDLSDGLPSHIIHRRIPRPSSARPAPPRVKRQGSAEMPSERVSSGNVIIDRRKDDGTDDDDDQFVVMEAAPQLPEMPEMETGPSVELDGNEKHGGLVKKILETKKEYETQQQSTKSAEKGKPQLSDASKMKEKDIVSKEIEKLRTSIQMLCRSALPLGKIMNYIQEDMDAMQNELQTWCNENRQHEEALLMEQSITENAVEPLKQELAGLEQQIKEQQDKICTVKANILRNEEKIQKMVFSINISLKT